MSKHDQWMPLNPGDYLGDTMHLTTLQHGAYFLMLLHYWRHGPPRDDDTEICTITGLQPRHWSRMRDVIRAFFNLGQDGLLHHKRVDAERDRTAKVSAIKSRAAKSPRKACRESNGSAPPPASAPTEASESQPNGHDRGAKSTINDAATIEHMQTHARVAVQLQLQSFLQKDSKEPPQRYGPQSGPDPPRQSPRDQVMQLGGFVVQQLIGLPSRKAHSFVGHLVKIAKDDCSLVLLALRQAQEDRPVDARTWLIVACTPKRERASDRMRRNWSLPSLQDAAD